MYGAMTVAISGFLEFFVLDGEADPEAADAALGIPKEAV